MIRRGAVYALLSAMLFGMSTPLAKALVGDIPPLELAGLLYLSSGAGLLLLMLGRATRDPGHRDDAAVDARSGCGCRAAIVSAASSAPSC